MAIKPEPEVQEVKMSFPVHISDAQAEDLRRTMAAFLSNPKAKENTHLRRMFLEHLAGDVSGRRLLKEALTEATLENPK